MGEKKKMKNNIIARIKAHNLLKNSDDIILWFTYLFQIKLNNMFYLFDIRI